MSEIKTGIANGKLHPLHLEDLRKSGLTDETIEKAGIESVPLGSIAKELQFNIPGIKSAYKIPYPETEFARYKCFYDDKNKGPKYLQRKNTGNRLYISPSVRPVLADLTVPLYFTEGEKKALKAAQEGLPCVGLSGLWNWKNKGSKKLIADFGLINFFDLSGKNGRLVYIVPDDDWLQLNKYGYRKNLKQAVYQLADKLKERGARVFIVELPGGRDE